jgi:hypothetical protein
MWMPVFVLEPLFLLLLAHWKNMGIFFIIDATQSKTLFVLVTD